MSIHKIPANKLSPEALQGVINELFQEMERIMVKWGFPRQTSGK